MSQRSFTLAALAGGLALATGALVLLRPDSGASTPTVDGSSVFTAKGCASCHDGPDLVSPIGAGPSLAGAAAWAGTRVDGLDAAAYLRQSITEPGAVISPAWDSSGTSPTGMPTLDLDEAELDAVVAYLLAEPSG